MKLIKKSTLFKGTEVELTKEEYKVYLFGFSYGMVEGVALGIILSTIIVVITSVLN